ncbi:MAG: nicotinamide mononucleotide transporter [Deltaproteobacteria bacterium]|nr:nicotinamide mononucleotide transporter [Candidatus Anaeroferrophillacea bacterium]
MSLILQLWGGLFYLTNKICFALAEGSARTRRRQLKIAGWAIYILGVPAWVIILVDKHNWIAAAIEAGGVPAMLLGLYNAHHHGASHHQFFDRTTSLCTYAFILLGVGYSLHDYGGITSCSQVLEIGVTTGFLLGSYLLAVGNGTGWLLFMLMNGSMGTLMAIQSKPILALQQVVSLGFVVYGFTAALKAHPRRRQT